MNFVTYEFKPRDPAAAPRSFVLNVITALDKHSASEVVKYSEQSQELIKKLIQKLQPPELRQRMLHKMEMWRKTDNSSLKIFADNACDLAKDVHEGEVARRQLGLHTVRYGDKDQDQRQKKRNQNDAQHGKNEPKKRKFNSYQKSDNDHSEGKNHHGPKKQLEWTKPCLNPDCDGIHPMKNELSCQIERAKG